MVEMKPAEFKRVWRDAVIRLKQYDPARNGGLGVSPEVLFTTADAMKPLFFTGDKNDSFFDGSGYSPKLQSPQRSGKTNFQDLKCALSNALCELWGGLALNSHDPEMWQLILKGQTDLRVEPNKNDTSLASYSKYAGLFQKATKILNPRGIVLAHSYLPDQRNGCFNVNLFARALHDRPVLQARRENDICNFLCGGFAPYTLFGSSFFQFFNSFKREGQAFLPLENLSLNESPFGLEKRISDDVGKIKDAMFESKVRLTSQVERTKDFWIVGLFALDLAVKVSSPLGYNPN